MFARHLGLSLLLATSSVAGPSARLPAVDLADGKATTHYERTQLLAALFYVVSPRVVPPGLRPAEFSHAIVLLWDDGRVLWSEDPLNGGPPYRTGFVTPARAAAVAERIKGQDPAVLTQERLGPEATFTSLFLKLGAARFAQMKSWHPRAPNSPTIATSRGLEARDGRDPAAVLAADEPSYRAFRRTWQVLEDELVAVAHEASAPRPVTAKLDWDWMRSEDSVTKLQLRLEWVQDQWRFVVEGPGLDPTTFRGVAELRAFLEKQPRGTIVTWDPGCKRMGNEPLLSSEKDLAAFKAFCAARGIELVIVPSG